MLILHETYDHWSVAVLTVTVHSSFFPTFDFFKKYVAFCTGFNLLTPIFMLPDIIMDLPIKVRDHCHYTGRYRGPAHTKCNLQYKILSYIPVVFHNLSGYDAHLFIKELAASSTDGAKMGVIAKNKEDYIFFSIKVEVDKYIDKNGIEKSKEIELRFIDSFKFMSSSLDSLINSLAHRGGKFFGFEEYNENQYKLLTQKGIYPYQYMTNWDKFKETKLPPREAFYSKLNMAGVREEDYEHALRVWTQRFGRISRSIS